MQSRSESHGRAAKKCQNCVFHRENTQKYHYTPPHPGVSRGPKSRFSSRKYTKYHYTPKKQRPRILAFLHVNNAIAFRIPWPGRQSPSRFLGRGGSRLQDSSAGATVAFRIPRQGRHMPSRFLGRGGTHIQESSAGATGVVVFLQFLRQI